MFSKPKPKKLVVSDSDIESALNHLNSLPYTTTKDMPKTWAKSQFIKWLTDTLPDKVDAGVHFEVATGVYGHIVPVGHGYTNYTNDERLLVILSIRESSTDLEKLNPLS